MSRRGSSINTRSQSSSSKACPIRQKITVVCLALGELLANASFSLLAPFYPGIAHKRGIDESTVGFVFGIYGLFMFVSAPVVGKLVPRFGPRAIFLYGLICCGSSTIAFGLLDSLPNDQTHDQHFIGLSLFLRSTAAMGELFK